MDKGERLRSTLLVGVPAVFGLGTNIGIQAAPNDWHPTMWVVALGLYGLGLAMAAILGWQHRAALLQFVPRLKVVWPNADTRARASASRTLSPPSDLEWAFERYKGYCFLGLSAPDDGPIVVHQFQATGRNGTSDPIFRPQGYVRSDKTGRKFPILFNILGKFATSDEIDPIPTGAGIDTRAYFSPDQKPTPLKTFLAEMVPFTFFFEYDGKQYRRTFAFDEIEPLIKSYEDEIRKGLVKQPQMTARPRQSSPPPVALSIGLNVSDIRFGFGDLKKDRHSELSIRVFNAAGRIVALSGLSGRIKFKAPNDGNPAHMGELPTPTVRPDTSQTVVPLKEWFLVLNQQVPSTEADKLLSMVEEDIPIHFDLGELNILVFAEHDPSVLVRLPLWDGLTYRRGPGFGRIVNLVASTSLKTTGSS